MADYSNAPDDVLTRMATHSGDQIVYWERALDEARRSVTRAESALGSWRSQRDEQYLALDERGIPAPDGTGSSVQEPEQTDGSKDGRGRSIAYAEVDGVPVCILDDGRWCEREFGHDGAHVIRSSVPSSTAAEFTL